MFFGPLEGRVEIARLVSETMEAIDQACLEIWYYRLGWSNDGE